MKKQNLEQIAHNIILHSSNIDDLGIFSGKIGAVIFLYHYSRHSKQEIYAYFAGVLLDDLFEDIHNHMTISFDKGLSGIGWGIEYVLKNNFVEGDSYEVLEDIDMAIMNWNVKRIVDETFESGLEGLFHYVLYHLPANHKTQYPFDSIYMQDLDIVASRIVQYGINEKLIQIVSRYITWREGGILSYDPRFVIKRILSSNEIETKEPNLSIGLNNGFAGRGLRQLDIFRFNNSE